METDYRCLRAAFAAAEDFNEPQNSTTTTMHCGMWQRVFKTVTSIPDSDLVVYIPDSKRLVRQVKK